MALVARATIAMTAACMLATMSAPPAHALDGFWHGLRSKFWHQGTNGEISNWYDMAPQSGSPIMVPDGIAIFAPGALRNQAHVTGSRTIDTVVFSQGTEPYKVVVRPKSKLTIKGLGAANAAATEQTFLVSGAEAELYFTKKATACYTPGQVDLVFRVNKGGKLFFMKNTTVDSKCRFALKSDSLLKFSDAATGGRANIQLRSPTAVVKFKNNSDPEKTTLDIEPGQAIFRTFGPNGDREISAKSIYCNCDLDLGKSNLRVLKRVNIDVKSNTSISVLNLAKYGRIHAASTLKLGGTLHVEGSLDTKVGTYTLFQSEQARKFKFSNFSFTGFRENLTAEIVYTNLTAKMVVSEKP